MAHRIRLRQPWTQRVLEQENYDTSKQVIFERHFNRPTGIESGDQIEVEVNAAIGEVLDVWLNEAKLTIDSTDTRSTQHTRFDLSDRLIDHNVLRVHLDCHAATPQLGDVNLWIEAKKTS